MAAETVLLETKETKEPPVAPAVTQADTTAHDDRARYNIARIDMLGFVVIVGGICAFLIYSEIMGHVLSNGILAILTMVVQSMFALILMSRSYYYGSSSGSTAKSVAAEKKAV
jgi:hypothetical protein